MTTNLFTTPISARLHDIVLPHFRQTIAEYEGEALDTPTTLLLYAWAVAIGTTVFNEAECFTTDAADIHVNDEAVFATTQLLPELQPQQRRLPTADDFLDAYQAILMFIAYRVDEGSDADEVVETYMDTRPDVPEPEAFAAALLELFINIGEAAVEATETGPHTLN